ncbi:MAG TPA: transcription antitermination factor NusB [Acetobacteraceae bacterium]|nr:transcription antitermination factor NusB [Acetobacteraceae bacterium]
MADPTRDTAFALLRAVLERRRPLEEALDQIPAAIPPRDRAAGHRLAAAVLRRTGSLDAVLEPFLRRAPPEPVRLILRLGAAQLLLLETPPHAAVATSVALARSQGFVPFAGLVNAVLRRVAEAGAAALEALDGPRLDTPSWLWSAWGKEARAIAEAHQHEAPLDLTLAPGAAPPLGGEMLPTGSVRFPSGTRVTELPGFAEGRFWVQDAAAALPARLLAARPGEKIADLCAAPGGKTAQLAAAGAEVIAVEREPARLARLRENLARLGLIATTIAADATAWRPPAPLDAVLLDAPCSATGTIRRHPDVPHLKRPRDIPALAAQQAALIEAAAAMLRPGGRLVYAVCSLQPEEGPEQARAAAGRAGLAPAPFTEAELAALPEARTPEGWLRTHPGFWPERGGMDGFFAARFIRV